METAIILGAGPAGLTAAYELLTSTNIHPILIENSGQVGGLSKTINYKGNLIDIGGHRFFSRSDEIVEWWLKFLPLDTIPEDTTIHLKYQNHQKDVHVPQLARPVTAGRMLLRTRKSRIYFNHAFFDYPLSLSLHTLRNFGFIKLCRIGFYFLRAKVSPIKNEENLEQFFINRFGQELYLTFFKSYTEKIWGVSCKEIPASWGHQRIKDLNIGKAIVQSVSSIFKKNISLTQKGTSTSLIEQFLYPQKGPGQIWEAVAQKIVELGGEIRLNTKFEQIISQNPTRAQSVICRDENGNPVEINGDYFFSTIPVKHLIRGIEKSLLPDAVRLIAENLQYRDFMIVGLLFKKSAGSENSLSSLTDNWIYLQDRNLIAGRMQIFNNWSPFMVPDPDTVWVGLEYFCRATDKIWNFEKKEMIDFAFAELNKTGLIKDEKLIDGTVIKVPKAYPSYTGSYEQFDQIRRWTDSIENLFLIGRNGMHRYNNTDHSMMTAMTAVQNITQKQQDRSNIWSVNMEQTYNEEK
jgi:protoporphyrinogen oxidase